MFIIIMDDDDGSSKFSICSPGWPAPDSPTYVFQVLIAGMSCHAQIKMKTLKKLYVSEESYTIKLICLTVSDLFPKTWLYLMGNL